MCHRGLCAGGTSYRSRVWAYGRWKESTLHSLASSKAVCIASYSYDNYYADHGLLETHNKNLLSLSRPYDVRKAASVIERRWKAVQYKKQFNYLKHAICAAVSLAVL